MVIAFTGAIYYTFIASSQNKKVERVPNDFEARYSWGACHTEWGRNDLKINKEGNTELALSSGFFKENKKYSFSPQEIAEIYGSFVQNNFFSLNSEYRDKNIIDGDCSTLTLKANGKSYEVAMINQSPNQAVKITEKLLQILKSKDSNYSKINKKQLCDEIKVACVTGKEYKGASCDFWNKSCEGI
ncbi:hypothetical protein HYU93_05195 [Candidatus Daviesbacteria bacterium]|nr:hypothetical protein [Candidatus Daviesbacteria bacterium]